MRYVFVIPSTKLVTLGMLQGARVTQVGRSKEWLAVVNENQGVAIEIALQQNGVPYQKVPLH